MAWNSASAACSWRCAAWASPTRVGCGPPAVSARGQQAALHGGGAGGPAERGRDRPGGAAEGVGERLVGGDDGLRRSSAASAELRTAGSDDQRRAQVGGRVRGGVAGLAVGTGPVGGGQRRPARGDADGEVVALVGEVVGQGGGAGGGARRGDPVLGGGQVARGERDAGRGRGQHDRRADQQGGEHALS